LIFSIIAICFPASRADSASHRPCRRWDFFLLTRQKEQCPSGLRLLRWWPVRDIGMLFRCLNGAVPSSATGASQPIASRTFREPGSHHFREGSVLVLGRARYRHRQSRLLGRAAETWSEHEWRTMHGSARLDSQAAAAAIPPLNPLNRSPDRINRSIRSDLAGSDFFLLTRQNKSNIDVLLVVSTIEFAPREFHLWRDLKDHSRRIRSALQGGAVEIARGVEDHIAERPPAVGSAGKVMQRSERVTAARRC
jgi:hypothetical protein